MWAVSQLVPTCYAHGYGKFGNCLTLKYIALCHYTRRWLLTSNSKVWMGRLCLPLIDNNNYFGCDCGMCYFTCVESVTLLNVAVQRLRWSNMEGPCVIMHYVIFLMWMAKFTHFLLLSLLAYDVCCDGNFQGQTLCWFKVEVLMDGIWDVLHLYWKKYWSKHGFFLGAQYKLEYLCN
jgi:hypothetical protein